MTTPRKKSARSKCRKGSETFPQPTPRRTCRAKAGPSHSVSLAPADRHESAGVFTPRSTRTVAGVLSIELAERRRRWAGLIDFDGLPEFIDTPEDARTVAFPPGIEWFPLAVYVRGLHPRDHSDCWGLAVAVGRNATGGYILCKPSGGRLTTDAAASRLLLVVR